jgi:hypothetical protein
LAIESSDYFTSSFLGLLWEWLQFLVYLIHLQIRSYIFVYHILAGLPVLVIFPMACGTIGNIHIFFWVCVCVRVCVCWSFFLLFNALCNWTNSFQNTHTFVLLSWFDSQSFAYFWGLNNDVLDAFWKSFVHLFEYIYSPVCIEKMVSWWAYWLLPTCYSFDHTIIVVLATKKCLILYIVLQYKCFIF